MTDNLDNSVLEHLRPLRAGQDCIETGLKEVKQRLTGVESGIAGLRRYNLFYQLPKLAHKDPLDRMLIWHAISRDLVLISKDSQFNHYSQYGLQCIW
jgi:PIN domain nuclease of toxin-antitoxin system